MFKREYTPAERLIQKQLNAFENSLINKKANQNFLNQFLSKAVTTYAQQSKGAGQAKKVLADKAQAKDLLGRCLNQNALRKQQQERMQSRKPSMPVYQVQNAFSPGKLVSLAKAPQMSVINMNKYLDQQVPLSTVQQLNVIPQKPTVGPVTSKQKRTNQISLLPPGRNSNEGVSQRDRDAELFNNQRK